MTQQITFSRLRDSEDWGIRGGKEQPTDQPPAEGSMVTVTKKSGEQQDVQMGRVVAQGDDWWLATVGASNNTKSCKACMCKGCVELRETVAKLVAFLPDPDTHMPTDPRPEAIDIDEANDEVDPWA